LRGSGRAGDSLVAAARELDRGHVVCLYPEGHLTSAADLRPGPGKSGAARLALAHPGVPVIPIGMWGPRPGRRHIWHRHTVRLVVGEPVDLTAWSEATDQRPDIETDTDRARRATGAIMARITELAEQARGARFDPLPAGARDGYRPRNPWPNP
ncbi:MAG TPA: lysophospholipid acyltransferase family protein, partial [Nakamurella sp.]